MNQVTLVQFQHKLPESLTKALPSSGKYELTDIPPELAKLIATEVRLKFPSLKKYRITYLELIDHPGFPGIRIYKSLVEVTI